MKDVRFLGLFAVFTLLYGVGMALIATDFGLAWDEPMRWESADRKLAYYEELFSSEDRSAVIESAPRDVYPGLYDLPLGIARRYSGYSDYHLSRIWNLLFGYIGLASVVMLSRTLALKWFERDRECSPAKREWMTVGTPFVPAVVLLCSPEYFTHLFINPKDMPFAAMYTLSIWALVRLFLAYPTPKLRDWLFLGVSIGLVMSIRPPGLVVYCYFGLFGLAWILLDLKRRDIDGFKWGLIQLVARSAGVGALAMAVLIPWWPATHGNPFSASANAVGRLQQFATSKPMLFQGELVDAGEAPWFYAVWMLLAKIPEWFALLITAAALVAVFKRRTILEGLLQRKRRIWALLIVAFSFCFPIAYISLSGASIHNGYRHMLYTLPPAAILAVAAWLYLIHLVKKRDAMRRLAFLASGALVLLSVVNIIRLHPYQYIYYNILAGGTSASYGSYETDYRFTTGKKGAEALNEYLREDQRMGQVALNVVGPPAVVEPFLAKNVTITRDLTDADFYLGRPSRDLLIEQGREITRIERMGVPLLVVVDLKNSG